MMKKIFSVLLSLSVVLSLSSCSPNQNNDPDLSSGTPLTSSDTAAEQTHQTYQETVITQTYDYYDENFPSYDEVQAKYPDKTVLVWGFEHTLWDNVAPFSTTEINEYLDSLGCDFAVCFRTISGQLAGDPESGKYYIDYIEEMLSSGEQTDLINVFGASIEEGMTNAYHNFAQRGLYEPLDEYFQTEAGQKLYRIMPENYWEMLRVNGVIYGIDGFMSSMGHDYGYFVNAELADKYGFDISRPIEEQIDILKKVKENEYCDVFAFYENTLYDPAGIFTAVKKITYAVYWDDETHSAKCILDEPGFLEKLQLYDTLKRNYLTVNYSTGSTFFIAQDSVKAGYTLYNDAAETVDYDYKGDGNTVKAYPVFNEPPLLTSPFIATGICSKSKYKEQAFELLALTQTDPYLNDLMVYGNEERVNNYDDDSPEIIWNSLTLRRFANFMICRSNDYYKQDEMPDLTVEQYMTFYDNADMSADIGFTFNGIGLEKELSATGLLMDTFKLPYGDVSLDEYLSEFREKLNGAGLQTIIDECNRQYEEWKNES